MMYVPKSKIESRTHYASEPALDRFIRFCKTRGRDQLTDRHIDHATSYLAMGRIHAMHATRHESRNVAQPAVPRWRINGDEIAGDGTRSIGLINTALNSLQRCVFIRTSVSQSAGRPLSQNGDGIRRRHPSKFARLTTPPVYAAARPYNT